MDVADGASAGVSVGVSVGGSVGGADDDTPAGAPGGRGGPLSTIRSPKTALKVLISGLAARICRAQSNNDRKKQQ